MDWYDLEFFHDGGFKRIIKFLYKEKKLGKHILPPKEDILNAFYYTPLEEVKVVIIGQDPYHQAKPQYAHGLAFSVRAGVQPLPKSLINILRELRNDIGEYRETGDLSDWAKQGVLLLNTSFTVCEGQAGSHSSIGWGRLVKETIAAINEYRRNVVFILWGRHAQSFKIFINEERHKVIKSAHPSPFSAHRGFFGSKPFSKTNKYLTEHNIEPIKW